MTTLTAPGPAVVIPRALVRLCSRSQRQLLGLRLGRVYGIGIGISYALTAAVAPAEAAVSGSLWVRCLVTASWVAGLGALSLSSDLAARDATQGVTSLARLRGFGESSLERARMLAGALRLGSTVLVPGLIVAVALLLKLRTLSGAALALSLFVLTVPYAALVGGVLAPLARACHHFFPGRGRWLLAGIVLGPWALGVGLGAPVPSIPGGFAWLLNQLVRSVS
ncbi:MAG: hypothetical protein EOO73_14200 [Myxococcales bacterium]|nr:MAG: hypothetical protein EOO73_14200 [Myxococcales bacterium]